MCVYTNDDGPFSRRIGSDDRPTDRPPVASTTYVHTGLFFSSCLVYRVPSVGRARQAQLLWNTYTGRVSVLFCFHIRTVSSWESFPIATTPNLRILLSHCPCPSPPLINGVVYKRQRFYTHVRWLITICTRIVLYFNIENRYLNDCILQVIFFLITI